MKKNIECLVVGPVATNCWIYPINEKEAAIIDPGAEGGAIISAVEKLDLTVKYILLTHGHFDHITAVPQVAKAFSTANPLIAIHREDGDYLGEKAHASARVSIKAAMGDESFINAFLPSSIIMPPAGRLLEEGDTIGPFTVIHLPGHTPGSIAFWDREEGVLFTGDTLFADGYGRTDLPGGDEEKLFASLKRLFTMDPGIRVYPGHDETTTIGMEAARGMI
uniref:Hydroxyacylglutathione hydrolase n=1 Tax=uncultured bacterium contig00015 TaxID=1181506 RepID=A0A806KLH6_9BACT|nr:hydroxyacylglutathione hydrolase [uncultured bacterium contig00015]